MARNEEMASWCIWSVTTETHKMATDEARAARLRQASSDSMALLPTEVSATRYEETALTMEEVNETMVTKTTMTAAALLASTKSAGLELVGHLLVRIHVFPMNLTRQLASSVEIITSFMSRSQTQCT